MITGLSTAAASSRSATVRACATVSRAAPCTCGAQRSEYASCTRVHSGVWWLAMIPEPCSAARMFAADVAWPGVRAQALQVGGEDGVGAEQGLDAHRGGDVGRGQQDVEVVQRQHEHAEHAVRAVDEGEALLLGERDRREPRLGGAA